MIKNLPFGELVTAVITPFKNDKIDIDSFEKILLNQCRDNSVNGIVIFGTTGEPLSLTESEKKLLFFVAKEILANRLPIIASISSPVTRQAANAALSYEKWGANAIMTINPYYYITTPLGIYRHFKSVCEATILPAVLYNVPKRTGCDFCLDKDLLTALDKIGNVCAIKECSKESQSFENIKSETHFKIMCGSDELAGKMLENGAFGCVSVCSNIIPKTFSQFIKVCKNNSRDEIEFLSDNISPLLKLLSEEPNPIPIKYAASKIFGFSEKARLPIISASVNLKKKIDNFIENNKELFL